MLFHAHLGEPVQHAPVAEIELILTTRNDRGEACGPVASRRIVWGSLRTLTCSFPFCNVMRQAGASPATAMPTIPTTTNKDNNFIISLEATAKNL